MKKSKPKLVKLTSVPKQSAVEISDELIATRAYEKWLQRGCPLWEDQQDWFAARADLEKERAGQLKSSAA